MSADQLFDALWGERPPASAGKILQGCVVRLRKVLGREAIRTSPHGYTLHLPTEDMDSLRFEDQVGRAREMLTLGEADRAAYLLTEALELWHGEAFAELESWEPAVAAGTRLSELRLEAEELRIDALLRAGRYREVLSEAQALVRAAPLREYRWVVLARAQYQSGQQGEALRTIHQLKAVLAEHLGIDPGPDVIALETSILRQDSSLLVVDAPTASATCPWLGLRPYGLEDAEWFFGRDADVAACLDILARTSVLALIGPSGSGKSSLLRAGVAAALRRRGQHSVTITPGVHPMDSLTALARAPRGAALLIDQCEELFSLCEEPEEQRSTGLGSAVLWLDYSDDGSRLVSGADDGGVSLWDATTLDPLGTSRGRTGPGRRAVHRRQPRRRDRVERRHGLPVGDRPRPGHRLRLPDGGPGPDRGGVGRVPARAALSVRVSRRVRGR
ncbi:DNA-binding transcriptional activator of the SARP family [Nocardioides sp. YR527]|nr:DNA-binding transcriptional activator of the SARP family [Nocardioides sp. YR527]